jgi:hypothetical protein
MAGTWYWVASYGGDTNNNPVASGATAEPVVVSKLSPSIDTVASPAAGTVGLAMTVADTATFSGAYNPTGLVSFALYSNNTCTAATGVSGSGTISSGQASYSTAPSTWTPPVAGTYYWIASYAGDTNNNGFTTGCGDADEQIVISPASPTIATVASPTTGTIGVAMTVGDTATFSGYNPTGSVSFSLYSGINCSGTPVVTGSAAILDGVAIFSTGASLWTPTEVGTYTWGVSYIGDGNNNPYSACGGAYETVTIGMADPTLPTTPSGGGLLGSVLNDSATVTGGYIPTGSITFNLYGPNNTTCAGSAIYTQTVGLSGTSAATSPGFHTVAVGTYEWTASYSGDTNNNPAYSGCGAEAVVITVPPTIPTITTALSESSGKVGDWVFDTATLYGVTANAGGTVTYTVYTNNTCTLGAQGAGTVTVTNHLVPNSNPVIFGTVGTWYWQAVYSGDGNNRGAASACTSETLVINATPTPTPTYSQAIQGATGVPTLPPTSSSSNGSNGNSAPLLALLICLAFGGLGLLAVQTQRRSIRG